MFLWWPWMLGTWLGTYSDSLRDLLLCRLIGRVAVPFGDSLEIKHLHHPDIYEGGLKSFRPNKETNHFSESFIFIFLHSLLVTVHTSPTDAPISVTRPNSTWRFSLQNNCSRR